MRQTRSADACLRIRHAGLSMAKTLTRATATVAEHDFADAGRAQRAKRRRAGLQPGHETKAVEERERDHGDDDKNLRVEQRAVGRRRRKRRAA